MPKEGDFITCPNKDCNGQASWSCLGEPEGDFYSCESCDGAFDENFKEIGDEEEFTIDHRRLAIISQLNRGGDEFKELKKEVFYYDEKLKCWLSKITALTGRKE